MLSTEVMPNDDCRVCGLPLPSGWGAKPCPHCLMRVSVLADAGGAFPCGVDGSAVVLGDCELIEEIGRGGMGVVYLARQRRLGRLVAVKVLAAGDFASPEARHRFRQEAEAAARLQHPGIVAIHDVGESDGLPWMSMDYVGGGTLGDLARDRPLAPGEAAAHVRAVAEAVHHAHAHGVFHRDLKPSNVLVDPVAGPRIADFGIARFVEGGVGTRSGEGMGSPSYSAPEQALGLRTADARTDVYGLGALLYHLLTARPPFHASTLEAVLLLLRETEPVAPRRLNPAVPRDLETICLQCLRKEPERRYASAREVSEDLVRFAQGQPIRARPVSAAGRTIRWCRRKPGLSTLIVLLALTAALSFWKVNEARRAAQRSHRSAVAASGELRAANARLAELLDSAELDRASDRFQAGETGDALALLARVVRRSPENPVAVERLASCLWHGGFAMPGAAPLSAGGYVEQMRLLPDGRSILLGLRHAVAVWDPEGGRGWRRFDHDGARLGSGGALSPDGALYAAWSASGEGSTHVFDVGSGRRLASVGGGRGAPVGVDFSPDGSLLVKAGPGNIAQLFEARAGRASGEPLVHDEAVACAVFSPDGRSLGTAAGGRVRFWDAETRRVRAETPACGSEVRVVAWAPRSDLVLAGCADGVCRLFAAADGRQAGPSMRHSDEVVMAVFDREGQRVLTASKDHTARLWRVADGAPAGPVLRHRDKLTFAAFSPDGRRVVTCASDHTARVWDAVTGKAVTQPLRHLEQPLAAVFLADGNALATSGADGLIRQWGLRSEDAGRPASAAGRFPESPDGHTSPDGRFTAVVAAGASEVIVVQTGTGERVGAPLRHLDRVAAVAFSPDGLRMATASYANEARLWETTTGRPLGRPLRHTRTVSSVSFSPEGARLATGSWDGEAQVWDIAGGTPVGRPLVHRDRVNDVRFSPDGRRIATGCGDGSIRIWDTDTGQPLSEWLEGEGGAVVRVEFSPDGQSLKATYEDGACRVWETPDFPAPPPAWLLQIAESLAPGDAAADHLAALAGFGRAGSAVSQTAEFIESVTGTENSPYHRLALRLVPESARKSSTKASP